MALNHFASQVKENQVNTLSKPAINNAVLSETSTLKKPVQQPTKVIAKPKTKMPEVTAPALAPNPEKTDNLSQTQTTSQITSEHYNPAKREIPLSWSDQQMMCALSAMQIRYGRPAEAIPYLMMIRKINPKNVEATRLLALSFMRLERWSEADAMVEEFDYLQKSNSNGVVDGLALLYRSLVSFKTNRVADAKSWFGKFRKFNKVS